MMTTIINMQIMKTLSSLCFNFTAIPCSVLCITLDICFFFFSNCPPFSLQACCDVAHVQNSPGPAKAWPLAFGWKAQDAGTGGCLLAFPSPASLPACFAEAYATGGRGNIAGKGTCCESWIPPVKPPSAADTCSLSVKAFQTPGSF